MTTDYQEINGLGRTRLPLSRSKRLLRTIIHLLSYHFILKHRRTTVTHAAGFRLALRPTVFHPRLSRVNSSRPSLQDRPDAQYERPMSERGQASSRLRRPGRDKRRCHRHQPERRWSCCRKRPRQWIQQTCYGGGFEPALGPCPASAVRRDFVESAHVCRRTLVFARRAGHAGPNYRDIAAAVRSGAREARDRPSVRALFEISYTPILLGSPIRHAGYGRGHLGAIHYIELLINYELRLKQLRAPLRAEFSMATDWCPS